MKAQQILNDSPSPAEYVMEDSSINDDAMDNKKGRFSKTLLVCMFIFLFTFVVAILYLFKSTGNEPSTLISCVFAFCSVEGGALAWIKTMKSKNGGGRDAN